MVAKMDLIIAGEKKDGHVLAAAFRQDASKPIADIVLLAGAELPIRDAADGSTLIAIAAQHLKVEAADLRDDVLASPRDFVMDNGLPEPGLSGTTLTHTGGNIKVTLPYSLPPGTNGVTVRLHIDAGAQQIVHQVQIPSGNNATEPLPLPSGSYAVLVLAPKVLAEVKTLIVP